VVAHLVPLWAFRFFPSQDGPAHLANASILLDYGNPAHTALRKYYVLNRTFTPNWVGHLMLAAMMTRLPPLTAEKVFLSGYVVLFPLAIRYALGAVRADARFLAALGFPFVYSYPLHMGFYTFCYSLAMFWLVSGYWLRHRERLGVRETVTMAAGGVLLYLAHPVSAVAVFVEVGLVAVYVALSGVRRPRRREGSAGARTNIAPLTNAMVALAPAGVLTLLFLLWNRQTHLSWEDSPRAGTLVKDLLSLQSLVSYSASEVWVARGVVVLFGVIMLYLVLRKQVPRALTFWNGYLVLAFAYALIYLVGPTAISSGSYLHERMMLFPFFALMLSFAAYSYGRLARHAIQAAAAALAGVLLVIHSLAYRDLNGFLTEYVSVGPALASNTTLLPITFSQQGDVPGMRSLSSRINVFLNAGGYLAAERHVVDLGNYEASQTRFFPTLFRSRLNPAEQLKYAPVDSATGDLSAVPTALLEYPQRTGGTIDYVLVWGARADDRQRAVPRGIFRQLDEAYDVVYTSRPGGLARLYRRKGLRGPP